MKELSNEQLVETIKTLRSNEKRVVAELIRYLYELDERKYYRELGYSSLHAYCTEALGYSDSAAWRRISAARALKTCPEISAKIENGDLSLCNASQIARVLTTENKDELLEQGAGKSARELEKLLTPYLPEEKRRAKAETVRVRRVREESSPLFSGAPQTSNTEQRFTVVLDLSQDEMALIEEAQKILSASKVKDTLLAAAKKLVVHNRRLKGKRAKRVKSLPTSGVVCQLEQTTKVVKPSRYVLANVRHAVEQRDGCQCSFVSTDGRRCSDTRNLQFDHILPFALGGASTAENLRLLCPSHNRLEAERIFGEAAIRGLVEFKQKGL